MSQRRSADLPAVEVRTMDISNRWLVGGMMDDGVVFLVPPVPGMRIPRHEALLLAAWLVAIAERHDGDFQVLLDRVRGT